MDVTNEIRQERERRKNLVSENICKAMKGESFSHVENVEKAEVSDDIQKAHLELFGDSIEKAVYSDTPQNRKLGRVGQEYHRGKGGNKEDTDIKAHIKALRKEIRELSKTSKDYGAMSRDHKNFKRLVELEAQLDEALKTKKSGKKGVEKNEGNNSEKDLTAVLRYSLLGNISGERQKYYNSIDESQSQNLKKKAKKQGYLHDDGHHLTQKGRDYLFEKIKGEIEPITKEQFDKILRKSPENQSGKEKKIYHIMNTLGRTEGKTSYSGEIDVKKESQKLQEWYDYAKKNNLAIYEFSHSKNVKELYFYNPKVFNACIKK